MKLGDNHPPVSVRWARGDDGILAPSSSPSPSSSSSASPAPPPPPPFTIEYFMLRAVGEVPRLVLQEAGLEHESIHYFSNSDWKERRKPTSPLGQLPILTDRTTEPALEIAESGAICRHLARAAGLYGATPAEQARVDMLYDASKNVPEIKSGYQTSTALRNTPPPAPVLARLRIVQGHLDANNAGADGSLFLVGRGVTIADLAWWNALQAVEEAVPGFLQEHDLKLLDRFRVEIGKRPRIAAYSSAAGDGGAGARGGARVPLSAKELGLPGWAEMEGGGYAFQAELPPLLAPEM